MKLNSILSFLAVGALSLALTTTALAKTKSDPVIADTISEALQLILDGKFDDYIKKFCHPKACPNAQSKKILKKYNLPATKKRAGSCLNDKRRATVKSSQPQTDEQLKVFIDCGSKRMPPPAYLKKDGAKWKIMRFSW